MFITEVVAIISVFGTILTIALMFFRTRHAERMALIDSGADAAIFYPKKKTGGSLAFKLGCLLTGVGCGFMSGSVVEHSFDIGPGTMIAPLIMIGGGVGLIISHMLDRKFEREDAEEQF